MKLPILLLRVLEWALPARTLSVLQGDALPQKLPRRGLILLRDGSEDWSIGLMCPCGCGQRIELPLIQEAFPRWKLHVELDGTPTLEPSIWLQGGCRSHFFVRCGKVEWV